MTHPLFLFSALGYSVATKQVEDLHKARGLD